MTMVIWITAQWLCTEMMTPSWLIVLEIQNHTCQLNNPRNHQNCKGIHFTKYHADLRMPLQRTSEKIADASGTKVFLAALCRPGHSALPRGSCKAQLCAIAVRAVRWARSQFPSMRMYGIHSLMWKLQVQQHSLQGTQELKEEFPEANTPGMVEADRQHW